MIPVCSPVLDGNERRYVLDCLDENWISSSGKYITRFERAFSEYCEAAHGVACSSGTAAVHLSLASLGIGPGDEVIIPTFTLIVSANAVMLCGAKPVLIDAQPDTWCIDPALIEEKITPKTKAIMVVHMYGHPCDMEAISGIAKRHGLVVIEDACQAHGALCHGRKVGSLSNCAAFSFYGNKNLSTGEGGMVVTNDPSIAERAALLRNQAFEAPRFVHRFAGFCYRMTNIQAAIGSAQCERAKEKIERKIEIASIYRALLAGDETIHLPCERPWARNVYWMFGLILRDDFGMGRDKVMARMADLGVETRAFFHPMHRQPLFQSNRDNNPDVSGRYPVSEAIGSRGLYLPTGLSLTGEQQREVVAKLLSCKRVPTGVQPVG